MWLDGTKGCRQQRPIATACPPQGQPFFASFLSAYKKEGAWRGASRRFGLVDQAWKILRREQINLPFLRNPFGTS